MDILLTITGTVVGNMLTFAMIYGLWRLTKDERDVKGMMLVAFTGFTVAGIAFLARSTL